jgi:nucleoside-diphosphate-sugar epimerase
MPILITGATGYLGSSLTQKLLCQGRQLKILCRKDPVDPIFYQKRISLVRGDILDKESIIRASKGVRQVYHLAAYARLWAKDPATYEKINSEGTRCLLNAARTAGVEKMVHVSTAGVVGPSVGNPMNEDMPRNAGFFNLYERTKWEAEEICREFAGQGFSVTVVNPSRIYGPGPDTGSNPVTRIIELYIRGKWKVVPGLGEDVGSYCYIEDVVQGLINAMERGRSGERYLLGGINASFNQLINTISSESGVRNHLWHLPFPLLKTFSQFQLSLAELTGRPPMITPDWVRKYKYHWALDSSKAIRQLGYHIRPLEEGVRETIKWINENRLK